MSNKSDLKCPNCGFSNHEGSRKCGKCGQLIKKYKSCPKCAKKNKLEAKKCVNCGYRFISNKHLVINNIIFSVFLILFLYFIVLLDFDFMKNEIGLFFRIIAIVLICFILYKTFNYGSKEIVDYGKNVDIKLDKKRYDELKKVSIISIISGTIVIIVILIYFLLIK